MTDTHHNNLWEQYLKAMGIQIWVRRNMPPQTDNVSPDSTEVIMPLDTKRASNELPPINEQPIPQTAMATNDTMPQPDESSGYPSNEQSIPQPVMVTKVIETTPPSSQPSTTSVSELDWETLQNRVVACTACDLHKTRTNTVFGVGNCQADLMLIGEAPGADEDVQGEPFVGRAGQLLNAMLYAIDLKREDVYIANVVKCRPPENRNPHTNELDCCNTFLQNQITLINPKLIVAVGRVAAHHLLSTTTSIGKLRGQRFEYGEIKIPLIATYHPAYLLRRPSEKRQSWRDLQFIRQTLVEIS